MKNFLKTAFLIIVIIIALPSTSNAFVAEPVPISSTENGNAAAAQRLINRLEEIKLMDTKSLSRKEKRALRHEVNAIEKELATNGGGIYISVGAIIIILLLIILL